MKLDEFEKHLQRQPLRQVPADWRKEILRVAAPLRPSTSDARLSWLSTFLWPNPKAWAGLGCVWILIFALHAASRGNAPMLAQVPTPKSANVMMTLKEREQTLVELIGDSAKTDAERPRRFIPQPRSECHCATALA